MRKVFLDDLPRRGKYIDWKKSVGYKVYFRYDIDNSDLNSNINNRIDGELEIVEYEKQKLKLKYNNSIYSLRIDGILKCKLGELLGITTKNYKYDVGDLISNKFSDIKILEQIRIPNGKQTQKGYKYECLKCSNNYLISEYNINKGQGCNVCSNHMVLVNFNDLWTTHPKIAQYLKFPEIGYEVSFGSFRNEIFKCPICGYERYYNISTVTNNPLGYICKKCSDHISYPNKFMYSFFDQLNEEYKPEFNPDWANGKLYDILLINRNEIWEMHGLQHYEESNWSKYGGRNLQEEQENDKIKKELAEKNGFKYIVVDCRRSTIEYIKSSILNIPEIHKYDLSNIDFLKCHNFACNSLVLTVSKLWDSGIRDISEIENLTKLERQTVIKYLKQGSLLNMCTYIQKKKFKRSIIQLTLDNIFISQWDSIAEASRKLNVNSRNICACCQGDKNYSHAGKFKWMYKEDYEKYIEDKNNIA